MTSEQRRILKLIRGIVLIQASSFSPLSAQERATASDPQIILRNTQRITSLARWIFARRLVHARPPVIAIGDRDHL